MSINNSIIGIVIVISILASIYISKKIYILTINNAKKNRNFRNHIASFCYMIINLGPSVSAFSIVSLITENDTENKITLAIVFIVGLLLNYFGRVLKASFFEKTKIDIPGYKNSDFKKVIGEFKNGKS
ncbi:hypothetical protein ACNSOL_12400 (plasmid) [Aliarcobacter lanthieri]|uniref:hypothetical protein n=1 Tax=Aliarcobacter lanthieri TaxID=1355374 RepID=UPI003AAD00E6